MSPWLGLGLVHYPQRTQRTFRSNFIRALSTTPIRMVVNNFQT